MPLPGLPIVFAGAANALSGWLTGKKTREQTRELAQVSRDQQDRLEASRQSMQVAQMKLSCLQQAQNQAFQSEENRLNRQHQAALESARQQEAREQAQLGREHQAELERFRQQVQKELNERNLQFQAWRLEQEQILQKELAGYARETQLLIAEFQRETARQQLELKKRDEEAARLARDAWKPQWASQAAEDEYGRYADLTLKGVIQRFRWIEAGTFLMGSPNHEAERNSDETQHSVTLPQGYWLADTACTQAFWKKLMKDNPANFTDNLQNPVEQVSWEDVQGFLSKLNQQISGIKARLPTEAEWEYACRAGTTTPFSFGATITPEQANYDGNYPYSGGRSGVYRQKTVAVKSLPANPWGLYEMHGNVWEWCQDWYGAYPSGSASAPEGPSSGPFRVLRGGSWRSFGPYLRSACRLIRTPNFRSNFIGFRLALG